MSRTRSALLILTMALVVAPVGAQQFPPGTTPRKVRPERVIVADPSASRPLTALGPDGTLYIDWDLVETLADGSMEQPRTEMARVLLAVRDGQWRHMPKR